MLSLVWNSNLIFSKGLLAAIDGYLLAHSAGLPVTLTVIGSPVADHYMSKDKIFREFSDRLSSNKFKYLGPVDLATSNELVMSSDCVILPSFYASECQPLAIISAMCYGCEVVATETPAMLSTLGDYPAWHAKPKPAHIAEIISEIARSRKVTNEDILRARKRFSTEKFLQGMNDVLC